MKMKNKIIDMKSNRCRRRLITFCLKIKRIKKLKLREKWLSEKFKLLKKMLIKVVGILETPNLIKLHKNQKRMQRLFMSNNKSKS